MDNEERLWSGPEGDEPRSAERTEWCRWCADHFRDKHENDVGKPTGECHTNPLSSISRFGWRRPNPFWCLCAYCDHLGRNGASSALLFRQFRATAPLPELRGPWGSLWHRPRRIQYRRWQRLPSTVVNCHSEKTFSNPAKISHSDHSTIVRYPSSVVINGNQVWTSDAGINARTVTHAGGDHYVEAAIQATDWYRRHIVPVLDLTALTGRHLVCTCPLTTEAGLTFPCHADILIALANPYRTTEWKNK